MSFDREDWAEWWRKIKWQLISFKFISFCLIIVLAVLLWSSLDDVLFKVINAVRELSKEGVIDANGAKEVINQTQKVLYDSALGHAATVFTAALTAIIAIKGVSYVMKAKQTQEVVKKLENGDLNNSLDKFMPKR